MKWKKYSVEEIKAFVEDHMNLKTPEELGQIIGYEDCIKAFKHGLVEGIVNGIASFCDEHYEVEGIE